MKLLPADQAEKPIPDRNRFFNLKKGHGSQPPPERYSRDAERYEKTRVIIYDLAGRLFRDEEGFVESGQCPLHSTRWLKRGSYLLMLINHKEMQQALFIKQ
jgi:hypothetical protein